MDNQKVFSKADLLASQDTPEEVYFKEIDGVIKLKKLTDGQHAEIEALKTRGQTVKVPKVRAGELPDVSINMDLNEVMKNDRAADILTCKYGMVENWSEQELDKLQPAGLVKSIAEKIYLISGATQEADKFLNTFRKHK